MRSECATYNVLIAVASRYGHGLWLWFSTRTPFSSVNGPPVGRAVHRNVVLRILARPFTVGAGPRRGRGRSGDTPARTPGCSRSRTIDAGWTLITLAEA